MSSLKYKIISVQELLESPLSIPNYQRPYKWTGKNVNQLISDIIEHKDKKKYRFGTLILHRDNDKKPLNIVDGQQRLLSLTLIVKALQDHHIEKKKIKDLGLGLLNANFSSDDSKKNIYDNYQLIKRRIVEFDCEIIDFFLNKCELVRVTCDDLSEAFQFFDSQNARGKELEPHDLLKAFHLRAMSESNDEEKTEIVKEWEEMGTPELSDLFGEYLYRIRNWSKGRSAREFTKDEIDVFKGINLNNDQEGYPFTQLFRIADKEIANEAEKYPFQIDQIIIHGKRFFEMVKHYSEELEKIKKGNNSGDEAKYISEFILEYDKKYRTGDIYVKTLFYCCLLYYHDKFGEKNILEAVKRIFIWAYSLRLKMQRVGIPTIDNYALGSEEPNPSIFQDIREALRPSEIINMKLNAQMPVNKVNKDNNEDLYKFFEKNKYLSEEGETGQ